MNSHYKTSVPDIHQTREANKILSRIKSQYRTACKRANDYEVENTLTLQEWIDLLNKSEGVCRYCGYAVGVKNLSPDHSVPLIEGGANSIENTVASCESCNLTKNKFASPKKHEVLFDVSDYEQIINFHEAIAKRSLALGAWLRRIAFERLEIEIGCYETDEVLSVYPTRLRMESMDIDGRFVTLIVPVDELTKMQFWYLSGHYKVKAYENTMIAHSYAANLKARYGTVKAISLPDPYEGEFLGHLSRSASLDSIFS